MATARCVEAGILQIVRTRQEAVLIRRHARGRCLSGYRTFSSSLADRIFGVLNCLFGAPFRQQLIFRGARRRPVFIASLFIKLRTVALDCVICVTAVACAAMTVGVSGSPGLGHSFCMRHRHEFRGNRLFAVGSGIRKVLGSPMFANTVNGYGGVRLPCS